MQPKNITTRASNFKDKTGQRIGCLVILKLAYCEKGKSYWACRCDCGKEKIVPLSGLHRREVSCHCNKSSRQRHGHALTGAKSPEYKTWTSIIQRCHNPKSTSYPRYGGRGISVCDRWRQSFVTFLSDMGHKPSPRHTIDRFPNQPGNYEPSNCRWATYAEQNRNHSKNRNITYEGRTMCMKDWASHLNINAVVLRYRLDNWSVARAFTEPVRSRRVS